MSAPAGGAPPPASSGTHSKVARSLIGLPSLWFSSRRALLGLCAIALLINVAALVSDLSPFNNDYGYGTQGAGRIQSIVSIRGPAIKAGLRVGDRIDVLQDGSQGFSLTGEPVHLSIIRGARVIPITLIPAQGALPFDWIARFLLVFWIVGFAALIVMRGYRTATTSILAMFLLAFAIQSALKLGMFYPSWAGVGVALFLRSLFIGTEFALLTLLAARFGTSSPVRERITRATFTIIAFCSLAGGAVLFLGQWLSLTNEFWATMAKWSFQGVLFPIFPCLLCGGMAFAAASGGEKQRLAWIFVPVGAFTVLGLVINFAANLGVLSPFGSQIINGSFFVVPLCLTYAALSRRLFDIGFVLNSAAVFAGVSVIVVGSFVLLEWALGTWFANASHATNLTLNIALALGLGVSLNHIHRKVDHFVDTAFFRKRHEDEAELRRFALESAFITDRETLLRRTYEVVSSHTQAPAAVLLLDGDHYVLSQGWAGSVARVGLNDPVILAMRARHDAVDLHGRSTAIVGEHAFPMASHGTLVGLIVCDAKKSGERFAPDEVEALKTLAHGVGIAFVSLGNGTEHSLESLHEAITTMQQQVATALRDIAADLRAPRDT